MMPKSLRNNLTSPVVTKGFCEFVHNLFSSGEYRWTCPCDCSRCIALIDVYLREAGGHAPISVAKQVAGFEARTDEVIANIACDAGSGISERQLAQTIIYKRPVRLENLFG